jgi:hypothetical protein
MAHPFGDEDQEHATEKPEDGEKLWEILKAEMIVKNI